MPAGVPNPVPYALLLATLRAMREIDSRNEETADWLMSNFLRTPWPSPSAQNQ
jgi:hypothetical protein